MKTSAFILLILATLISCTNTKKIAIDSLTCEYLESPQGVDVTNPRFSWKLISDGRSVVQSAYRIQVADSKDKLKSGSEYIWDTGKRDTFTTFQIKYEGPALKSNTTCFWRVGIWDKNGKQFWSQPASFHTGLFQKSDWQAKWITTPEEITDASPLLRKEFSIEKKVISAFAYTTAGGYYEFYLNGKKVGDHVLDPGITDYPKTILYSTYDVTNLLKSGKNVAGAMLGNGAFNMRQTQGRYSWRGGASLGNPRYILQLMITFEDGTQQIICTDDTWKYSWGPITFNNIYGGEDYDATKEQEGWSTSEFKTENWKPAVIAENPGGVLKSQMMPPVKVTETIQPVAETSADGVFLFDLGQNIAGWWRIQVKGKPGMTIRIRGAETLNDSLFPKPLEKGDRMSTKFRYHSQTWTDYTLKSSESEIYEPRFFYSGFRYIEVTGLNNQIPESVKIEGRVVRSALERNGTFECSDSLLNRIHKAGIWSQMANTVSYPTDCPHREKGAYNGDGQVIAETSIHDFQMAPFYTNWLNDMRDAQEENGRIPNTSPTLVGGMGGGVAWGSAYILIPWWMSHYYGDVEILREHYPTMKKYIGYLKNLGTSDANPEEPFIINYFDGYWYSLGEWCSPGRSDGPNHEVVNTFYYYYNCQLMAKIADKLGFNKDYWYFSNLSDTIKSAFNKKFFNKETGLYGTEETYQTYQLLALLGKLVPEGYQKKVFNTIVDDIKIKQNGHLNTGIIGTKYLWPTLVDHGFGDLAFEVATQTDYPGYGYWIKNNSTTLLEAWSGKNSHNHQMFGSITEYFYKYLAGIQSPGQGTTTAGYHHIQLHPRIPEKLEWANASLETVSGEIVSEWKKEKNAFSYHVSIPANTTATVVLPLLKFKNVVVKDGNQVIWENNSIKKKVNGIMNVIANSNSMVVNTGSGDYQFTVTGE